VAKKFICPIYNNRLLFQVVISNQMSYE